MKTIGSIILTLGICFLIFSLSIDPSVNTIFGRINNIGLINDKQNYIIVSSLSIIVGMILYFLQNGKDTKDATNDDVTTKPNIGEAADKWIEITILIIGIVGAAIFLYGYIPSSSHSTYTGVQQTNRVDRDSTWSRSNSMDPMTDQQIISASKNYNLDGYKIYITISCRSNSSLEYVFESSAEESGKIPIIRTDDDNFALRVDDQPPFRLDVSYPKGLNSIEIVAPLTELSSYLPIGQRARLLQQGAQITVKLTMTDGPHYLSINQTDNTLRSVLDECAPRESDSAAIGSAVADSPNASNEDDKTPPSKGAKCLLTVGGKTFIDGPCRFYPREGGSFQISDDNIDGYFADVDVEGSIGHGNWNEEAGVTHAHSSLGDLQREGACWINDQTRLCAW